ncbi:MAG: ATP-binding protein [Thermoanaerobaculia bacterium]
MNRLCLIGPECTGKTTIAGLLAEEHGTTWSREHAREYAERAGRMLTALDVGAIAAGQIANQERAEKAASGLVILDTDLISTVVYARHYYGACPAWIEEEARNRRADLYLLLDTGLPWRPDGVRDAGGDVREALFEAFRRALDEFGTTWVIVSGGWEERVERARALAMGMGRQDE